MSQKSWSNMKESPTFRIVPAAALVLLALAVALPLAVAHASEQAAAQAVASRASAANAPGSMAGLYVGNTYTGYDVTGDGRADTLTLRWTGKGSYGASYTFDAGLAVAVNGKRALTISRDKFKSAQDGYEIQLVTLGNGTPYLYAAGKTVNSVDYTNRLYAYKGGKFEVAYDLHKLLDSSASRGYASYGYRSPRITGVSGNTIAFRAGLTQSMVGCASFNPTLKYSKGKLVASPKTLPLDVAYWWQSGKGHLIAKKTIPTFKKATGSARAFTIKKGDKVKVDRMHIRDKAVRVHVRVGNKAGWMKLDRTGVKMSYGSAASGYKPSNQYFTNITVAG